MNKAYPSVRWTASLRWFGFTLLGLVAGLVAFFAVGSLLGDAGEEASPAIFGLVLGAIFGTTFGVSNWLCLRHYLPGQAAWVPATIVAFALAAALVFGLLNDGNSEPSFLLRISHAIVVGLSLGFAQWLVLRRRVKQQVYLWVIISVVGWVLAEITGIILEDLADPPLPLMITFLFGASLPGIGMVWLLQRQHVPDADLSLVGTYTTDAGNLENR